MNQADETGASLSGYIAESRTRLLAGESPAAIADDLQAARLSTIEMMLVCMRATGGSLGE